MKDSIDIIRDTYNKFDLLNDLQNSIEFCQDRIDFYKNLMLSSIDLDEFKVLKRFYLYYSYKYFSYLEKKIKYLGGDCIDRC